MKFFMPKLCIILWSHANYNAFIIPSEWCVQKQEPKGINQMHLFFTEKIVSNKYRKIQWIKSLHIKPIFWMIPLLLNLVCNDEIKTWHHLSYKTYFNMTYYLDVLRMHLHQSKHPCNYWFWIYLTYIKNIRIILS